MNAAAPPPPETPWCPGEGDDDAAPCCGFVQPVSAISAAAASADASSCFEVVMGAYSMATGSAPSTFFPLKRNTVGIETTKITAQIRNTSS